LSAGRPEIPWATPTDITGTEGNEIRITERSISTAGLKQSTLVPENSVLMTSRATIGAAKINRVPMAINQGFAALCAKEGHSAEYLFHLLEILRPTLIRLGAGTTFLETSRREIRKVQVRVPDEDEQRRIAAALKLADDAIQKARAEMDAARQLRRSAAFEMLEKGMPGRHADPATIEPELAAEVQIGDIIVSRANTTELCGAVHRVHSLYTRLLLCDKTWRLHPKDDVNPDWLVAALKHPAARKQIEANATGTSDSMKNEARFQESPPICCNANACSPAKPAHRQDQNSRGGHSCLS
jgi:hypothetical protein